MEAMANKNLKTKIGSQFPQTMNGGLHLENKDSVMAIARAWHYILWKAI